MHLAQSVLCYSENISITALFRARYCCGSSLPADLPDSSECSASAWSVSACDLLFYLLQNAPHETLQICTFQKEVNVLGLTTNLVDNLIW